MGYDANLKSKRAVKQQRLTIILTLIGLALACTLAVNFLRRPKDLPTPHKPAIYTTSLRNKQQQQPQKVVGNNDKLLQTINAARKDAGMEPLTDESPNAAELEAKAAKKVAQLEEYVRAIKKTGVIMEKLTPPAFE